MSEIHYLDEELMEIMCHRLAVNFFDTINEPIPPFPEHDEKLLNLALNAPRQTFDGKDLHPTTTRKAVVLYYALNKLHPFTNGNKRIATTSLVVFLHINSFWLALPKDELLAKTLEIAKSLPEDRERILEETERWILQNVRPVQ